MTYAETLFALYLSTTGCPVAAHAATFNHISNEASALTGSAKWRMDAELYNIPEPTKGQRERASRCAAA